MKVFINARAVCLGVGGLWWGIGLAHAQEFGPEVFIPITQHRQPYQITAENGQGQSCGAYLMGSFPVFKNYTNRTSYALQISGLAGWSGIRGWDVPVAPPGGQLLFTATFSGCSGSFVGCNDCGKYLGAWPDLPPWTASIRPRGPVASFTFTAVPTVPGLFDFRSTSTEPEGEMLTERWEFGDGGTSTATSVNHRYVLPGNITAHLTVTDTDGLTNRASRAIVVPAPKLESSLRMPDHPPGDTRVILRENFKVRLRILATDDGVGALDNARFTTNAVLSFPEWLTVIEQPSSTQLGLLQPGESRLFDFVFRAENVGKFAISSSAVSAVDAVGRPVTGQGAVLNGSVPGLLVEVVFPEEPVRLSRKEQGEGDGLSEKPGYKPQGFPVIFRVSVPKNGPPVRDVRLNNAEANDGGLDIDRVKRTTNPDVPWVQAVPQPVPFPLTVTNKASPSMVPGLLTESNAPVEFTLMVETDTPGDFSFTGIVSAHREDGTGEVTEVGSDVMTIGGDVLLAVQLELVHPLVLPRITEGEAVEVWGKVKNLTWDKTIRLHPVRVISQGQGFVQGPVPSGQEVPPLGIPGIFDPVLAPREDKTFRARVKTEVIPGLDSRLLGRTNVLLDFAVGGVVVDEQGEERDLEPQDMLAEWGKGRHRPGGGATLLRARVDPDPQDTRLLSAEDFFYISAGKAMENLAYGAKDAVMVTIPQALGSLIPGTWALLDLGGAATVETYFAVNNAGRYLWAWLDWQTDVYLGLESETRRQQYQLIADELFYYYRDRFDSAEQVRQIVNQGIEGYFGKVIDFQARAYEASSYGFNEELAGVVGEPFRAVGALAVEELVSAAAVATFVAKTTRSRALLDEAAESKALLARRSEQQVADATADVARRGSAGDPRLVEATPGMRALPAGTKVTPRQALEGWAVDKVSDQNLRKMTDVKNGGMAIIVALRSRADETIEWMKTQRGIVPKPVSFKPKNVDADDVAFLGYRDGIGYGDANGVGAGDRGATAIAEPFTRGQVIARLDRANADAVTRKRVLERHDQRWEEWYGAKWPDSNPLESPVEKFKRLCDVVEVVDGRVIRKGRLPVPKRGTVPDPSINLDVTGPGVMDQRRFEMRQVMDPPDSAEFPNGREYYETWLEDDQGTMRRIAGDIDLVAVTDATGHALNPASEFTDTVARNLQHAIQAQHPWSSSLMKDSMRKKFLDPHRWHPDPAERGEPLLLYVNGEARVGWFHPTRAITAENPLDGFMWLDGGTGDVDDVVRFQRDMRGTLDHPADVAVASFTPHRTSVRAAMIDSDNDRNTTLLATCAIRTTRTGGAIYRLGQSETLEKRAEDGTWQPADPALQCDNGEILIVPDTALRDDVVAGTLRLPIIEEMLGFDWRQMFRIGDQILIDPGAATEELRTIVDHGSLILDRPLTHFHPMGTPIVLYRTRAEMGELPPVPPPFRGEPLVWLRADAGLSLTNGTNVLSWTDQSRNNFVFSPPTAATRPFWIAGIEGRPAAVRFGGSASPHVIGNLGRTLTNATIFTLGRYLDTGGGTRYIFSFGTRNFSGLQMTLARQNSDGAFHFDGAASWLADNTIPGTNLFVFSQVFGENSPDEHRLMVGTKTVLENRTTVGRAYSAVATNVYLGRYPGLGAFGGDIVEWIIYDRSLNATERLEVEEYLRQRAGLPPFFAPGSLALDNWQVLGYDHSSAPEAAWVLDEGNRSVVVPLASDPSLLLSPFTVSDQVIRVRLNAPNGPGSMGFVFGYQGFGHFYLLDWQQAASTHPEFGAAPRGLRLRAIHIPDGTPPTGMDLWSSPDTARVTTLRTHDAPWVAGREYELVMNHQPGRIELAILDGDTAIIAWEVEDYTHPPGQFGFYVNALADARFGQVTLPGMAPVVTGIQPDGQGNFTLDWIGGVAPYLIETTADLGSGEWFEAAPATPNLFKTITPSGEHSFFRIRSSGVAP